MTIISGRSNPIYRILGAVPVVSTGAALFFGTAKYKSISSVWLTYVLCSFARKSLFPDINH